MKSNVLFRLWLVALAAMVSATALSGCPPQMDPESQQRYAYLQTSDSYQATVKILVAYRQTGKIDDAAWAEVKTWDNVAYAGLTSWQDALAQGKSPEAAIASVNTALQELLKIRIAAQAKEVPSE